MLRFAALIGLLLLSAGAIAAEPAPAESEQAGCPRVEAEASESPERAAAAKPAPSAPTTAPVRARSSGSAGRSTAPRWNTLLPGMIR